jgi:copper homeostasis protein
MRLEVIACSLEDALAAEEGGADRIELIRDLPSGGLTPSLDLIDAVLARVRIPVRVMVRETVSHAVIDPAIRSRLRDAASELAHRPTDGIVFGALSGANIDRPLLRDVVEAVGGKRVTFHRAFESVADPIAALGELGRTEGVDRVLTNGGAGDWPNRLARLADWARACPPHLQIIVGGGVTSDLLRALAATPGVREVHVGRAARAPATDEGRVVVGRVQTLADAIHAMST